MPGTTPTTASPRPSLRSLTPWSAQPSLPRNVVLNWSATVVTILSTLIVTPIIVRSLEKELYGIWSFLNGLLTYADLLYLGLGAALVKYAAEHLARRDAASLNRLCSVVLSLYLVLGVVSLAISALVAPFVPDLFANGVSASAATAARYTCLLLGFRLLSLFVASLFAGALVAADRTDVVRIVTVGFTLLRLAVIPVVLHARSPLVALALVVAISAACETVAVAWLAARFIPGLRPRLVRPARAELRVLYGFGVQSFVILMAVKLITYTDQTVIGLTLGAASVALYALPLQLIEYGRVLVNGLVAVLLPRLTVLHMNNDRAGLAETFITVSRISCAVAGVLNAHLIMLGTPFLALWVGHEFGQSAQVILACLGLASVLQAVSTQAPLPFFQATGHLRVPALVLLAEGAVNLALTLVLIPRFGLNGVALGTLIPSFCISFLVLPVYVCRKLHLPPVRLVTEAFLPAALMAGAAAAALAVLNDLYPANSYQVMAFKGVVTLAVVAAGTLALSRRERQAVLAFAARFRKPVSKPALMTEE